MVKIDKDTKKRWLYYTMLNALLIVLLIGALFAGFGYFAADASRNAMSQALEEYAHELDDYSLEELTEACEGKVSSVIFSDPSYRFGIYKMRGDNAYEFISGDSFLLANTPSLGARAEVVEQITVAGHNFLAYTTSIEGFAGTYVRVFSTADFLTASDARVAKFAAPFAISFLVLCVVIALLLGYIEIRPIVESYYKQKNFINDMSHEIRTPLAIIKGNLENVRANPENTVEKVDEELASCLDEVDYISNLASGLLNIVRGESKSSKKDAVLSEAVYEAVDMFADVAAMSGKALLACVDYCDISVDREKLKQLMSVLIENALKYTREGDRINVRLKNTKDGCVLSVSDTGIGVDKNDLELIFDRFYRGENAKDIAGTGLGLAIAKSIVESERGTIKAVQNVPSGLEIITVFKRG